MVEPIDIMSIAARHLYNAKEAMRGIMAINYSPASERASQMALTMMNHAMADMDAAQRVAFELGEQKNALASQ